MSLDRYCRYLFLTRLSQLSPSKNFSSRDIHYLKISAHYFITGENQTELINLYKNFEKNEMESEKISDILSQKFIEYKIRPPSALLVHMFITPALNNFLQSNPNLDDKSAKIFQSEYMKTTREAMNAIEKGDFFRAVKLTRSNLSFYSNNKAFITDEKAWLGLTQVAKEFYYKGKEDDANEFFSIAKVIAPPERQNESLYNLIWPKVVAKDDKALMAAIQKYNLEKMFSQFESKMQYWIAYAFYKNDEKDKALEMFNKIVSSSPYSFYSILSLKMLALNDKDKNNEQAVLAKLIHKDPIIEFPMKKLSDALKHSLIRLAVWQKIEQDKFIKNEVRFIQAMKKETVFKDPANAEIVTDIQNKDFLTLNLVRLLNSKSQFLSSFKIFQESLDQNSLTLNYKLIKYVFPLSYIDLIKKNAQNLDPLMVISLVRQESSFNPNASSVVGAIGLMQLMPATARRFNARLRSKHLVNPEINIPIGVKYLKQLITRYDGNLIYALASYNAGESRIDKWKRDIFKSEDPIATIEAIPFEETRNYVKLIYRNYFFYSLLSQKSILMTPIQDSFKVTYKK